MNARITLIGMENALNQTEDVARSLKDPWEIEGTDFDSTTLLSTIMIKGGQMEPLFSDPRFFYTMNQQWWNKWLPTFSRWWDVLENREYNPIWNKDYYEETHEDTTDTGTLDTATSGKEIVDTDTTGTRNSTETMDDDTTYSKSGDTKDILKKGTTLKKTGTDTEVTGDKTTYSKSGGSTEQLSGKDKTTHNSDRDITVENKVSAYDSSTYQPHDQSHTDDTLNSENTETTYGKKTEVTYHESGNGTDNKTVTMTHDTTDTGTEDSTTTGTYSESGSGTDDKTTEFEENTSGTVDTTVNRTGTVDTDTTNDRDFDHTSHQWGNIGVTTSQQMVEAELQLRYWNIYEHISDIFLDEMAVRVF